MYINLPWQLKTNVNNIIYKFVIIMTSFFIVMIMSRNFFIETFERKLILLTIDEIWLLDPIL